MSVTSQQCDEWWTGWDRCDESSGRQSDDEGCVHGVIAIFGFELLKLRWSKDACVSALPHPSWGAVHVNVHTPSKIGQIDDLAT